MCLILVAWQWDPRYPLVVAANRDEFYARPSREAARWPENTEVLGGRDLEEGGTWLGVREDGRFAAVTNVREPGAAKGSRSRGLLVKDFLLGHQGPKDFNADLDPVVYSGYNLLTADEHILWYGTNRGGAPRSLPSGIYGLSNHLLDTPWPKLATAKTRFARALATLPDPEPFFTTLADRSTVPDTALPDTGVPLAWERLLSSIFIASDTYGTRAATVLTRSREGRINLEERRFGVAGEPLGSEKLQAG
jgi:uncharacterized protein with NRDE domain